MSDFVPEKKIIIDELVQNGPMDRALNEANAELQSVYENALSPKVLSAGILTGNLTMQDGKIESGNFITRNSGWQIKADGTAEFNNVSALNISIKKNFIAYQNLTAGDKVGITNLTGNVVTKFLNLASVSPSVTAEGAKTHKAKIATDKIIFVYDGVGTTTVTAVVCSIDRNSDLDSSVSFGTPVTITTTQVNLGKVLGVCELTTDKFAVVYNESGDATLTKLVVATVSGTTITLGTPVTVDSSATAVVGLAIGKLSTDKGIISVQKATNYNTYAFTVSGTIPTIGSAVAQNSNIGTDSIIKIANIGTDKVVLISKTGYSQVASVSGTTITFGTAVMFATTSSTATTDLDAVSPIDDIVFIAYKGSSLTEFICGSISGTTITFGSAVTATGFLDYSVGAYADGINTFYVYLSGGYIVKVTRSGTTLTFNGLLFAPAIAGIATLEPMIDLDDMFAVFKVIGDGTSFRFFIQGMSATFLGIAQEDAIAGGNVLVLLNGIDNTQTNLIPGSYYSLGSDGEFAVTTSLGSATAKALSDTELLLL